MRAPYRPDQFAAWATRAQDADVENPETNYAIAPDGVYLAYQTLGTGETPLVWQTDWPGNIDFEWDDNLVGTFLREIASFTRVITHDQRGIGLSSRNVAPADLETRAADLRVVLDAAGADRVVLCGVYNSGGVNAMLAATDPERVHSLVWMEPSARTVSIPDYPWGSSPEYRQAEAATLELWGTSRYGPAHAEHENAFGNAVPTEYGDFVSRQSRNACTPDVAKQMSANWYEIDVRAVLPAVKCPTLLLTRGGIDDPEANHLASLMSNAEIRPIPPGVWTADSLSAQTRTIRDFMGVEPPPPALDSVLAAVLFTDIVGSTAKQAAVGDAGWKTLLEQHHAAVRHEIERWHGTEVDTAGDGFYATFEGPARAVRCAIDIGARVRDLGLEIRAGVHVGECTLIDGKVGGLPVTIGARIAALAGVSEVWVSQTVKDLVPGSGLAFEGAGDYDLKGVPERWRLFRVTS
jgi:class 3 adenylate cyclase/pimeloyl-ACP methyl ester carboxylesterase